MSDKPVVVLLIDSARTCEREFLRGVARYSRLHGPWMFYHKPQSYISSSGRSITALTDERGDIGGAIVSDMYDVEKILGMNIPVIVHCTKGTFGDLPRIVGDCDTSGRMGAEHLTGCGFSHFAFCGLGDFYWSAGRGESFARAIEDAGFAGSSTYTVAPARTYKSFEREKNKLQDWLVSLPKPVGIMTAADHCSRIVLQACEAGDIHVPDEVAIIGVDNDDMVCELSRPTLSSIALNFEGTGFAAAECLDTLMRGARPARDVITVEATGVVTRESTDILATDDRDIAAAIRFIRKNTKTLLQVEDVLRHVCCSRRYLHTKFKRVLGRSVYDEIRRTRIEQIARHLRETDRSISQIARDFGYNDANHIARYFRHDMGMNPLEYRRKFTRE